MQLYTRSGILPLMPVQHSDNQVATAATRPEPTDSDDTAVRPDGEQSSKEIGGCGGPDPTRYGDWEKAGRCIDF